MPRLLKSLPQFSLKLLGTGILPAKEFLLEVPNLILQAALPGVATSLKHTCHPPGPSLVDTGGWLHGGLNE